MNDETLSAKKKIQIALVTFAILWALLSIIYAFGGFDRWTIGIYWYDLKRFIEFIYHKAVAPVGAFCIAFKFLLYLISDDEEGESKISKKIEDLKYEQSRIEGMVDKNRSQSHNAIIRIQDLEAKMEVICSILSLNKTDELKEAEDDILGEA